MQHFLAVRNIHRARGFLSAIHVGQGDFAIFNRHHAVRIAPLDMAARDAGVHFADLAIGHQLGFAQSALNRRHGFFDVDHDAALEAFRDRRAQADHIQRAVVLHFGRHGDHFGGADIKPDNKVLAISGHLTTSFPVFIKFNYPLFGLLPAGL